MPSKKEGFKLGKSQANPKTHASIEEEDEIGDEYAMTPARVGKGGKVGRKRTDSIDSQKGEQKQVSGGKSSSINVKQIQKLQAKITSQAAKVVVNSQTYNKTRELTGQPLHAALVQLSDKDRKIYLYQKIQKKIFKDPEPNVL